MKSVKKLIAVIISLVFVLSCSAVIAIAVDATTVASDDATKATIVVPDETTKPTINPDIQDAADDIGNNARKGASFLSKLYDKIQIVMQQIINWADELFEMLKQTSINWK